MDDLARTADICLVLEGTYPYVTGGVSGWVHDLIRNHPDLKFSIAALLASGAEVKMRYELPQNVISIQNIFLQDMEPGSRSVREQTILFHELQDLLMSLHQNAGKDELARLVSCLSNHAGRLGSRILLDSPDAWGVLTSMYRSIFPDGSFLDFFWSWRCLVSGLYSVLLPKVMPARVYHAVCTGFAGVYAARAAIETGAPCLLTEHGIYTNERRIELSFADWFHNLENNNLLIDDERLELRDYWFRIFKTYSRICYQVSNPIITLFEANKQIQEIEGAAPARLRIIPNGIDFERFSDIERVKEPGPKTIALIGRAVPIKGVKTYILACSIIAENVPDFLAYVLGPTDEDPEYYGECCDMVERLGLQGKLIFTGGVNIRDYLGKTDLLVLTSISEAQPLVILEAGAAGIPVVATDVGSCREIVFGKSDESPNLGVGGSICRVSDAREIAEQIIRLLNDDAERIRCGASMKERVRKYYNKSEQHRAYKEVYQECLARAKGKGS